MTRDPVAEAAVIPGRGEPTRPSRGRHSQVRRNLLAIGLGVLPLYAGTVILHLRRGQPISTEGFTVYLAVISPVAILVALLVLRLVCAEHLRDLNLRPGRLSADLLATIPLAAVVLVANAVTTFVLSGLFPEAAADPSVRRFFGDVVADLWRLLLFAGPLLFLGAASEEVVRALLLSRLWKVWPSTPARLGAIAVSAALFALLHLFRGPVAMAWAGAFGVIMGLYYFWSGRVLPMVLAHYLTNAIQLLAFAARTP